MQTWAKRGLKTALVTGGLLMLGTGIASADEDVNPDRPASPLDGSVTVPVHLDDNALGTPVGQKALPGLHQDIVIRASDVTGPAGRASTLVTRPVVAGALWPAAPVAAKAHDVLAKAQGTVAPLPRQGRDLAAPIAANTEQFTDELASLPGGDRLPAVPSLDRVSMPEISDMRGKPGQDNRVNADVVVPVDVSGNAVATGGAVATTGQASDHEYGTHRDVVADGSHSFVGGNVVDLDWATPVQVTNNAVAGAGTASAAGTSSQAAWSTGDVVADGAHSLGGGNVVAPQFATPVQVDGNAVAGGGWAVADSGAHTAAASGGTVLTSGEDSTAGGNAVPVPVAVPARVNGNAIAGVGEASGATESTAFAVSGANRTGTYNVPTYVETNGDPALAAGNIVQPGVSGPAMLCGNAGVVDGNAEADCDTATATRAGGTNRSTGAGSVASGAIAAAPVALPAQGFGNAAGVIGESSSTAANAVDSKAGGDSYTRGHDSIVSGTTANAPVASTADVFGNAAGAVGEAWTTDRNDVVAVTGGHTGTTGDDSTAGGNMVTVPLNTPAEAYGNAVSGVGSTGAAVAETKDTVSGRGSNTRDPNGLAASNLVTVPVTSPAQLFGNGAGALGFTDTEATADNRLTSGGDSQATGTAGFGSGNIGQVPVSVPAQVFGSGVTGLGRGTQYAANQTDMSAGGQAVSDGTTGAGAGNVVTAPVAGAAQLYGESAAGMGFNDALTESQTATRAGGDTATSGREGLLSGNVAAPQALPVAQSFAFVASALGGFNASTAANQTAAQSGGDIETTGDEGKLSGNLVDAPAGAYVQPFGDAVSAANSGSYAEGLSTTEGKVGGTSTTGGAMESLSGIDGTVPLGASVPVYDVPGEVLAQGIAESAHRTGLRVADSENHLKLPVDGPMTATELPSFAAARSMSARSMPANDLRDGFAGVLTGLAQLNDATEDLPQILPAPVLGRVPTLPGVPSNVLPEGAQPSDILRASGIRTMGLPTDRLHTTGLPTDSMLDERSMPTADLTGDLPTDVLTGGLGGGLPTDDLPTDVLSGDGLPVGDLPTDVLSGGGLPVGDLPTEVLTGVLPVNGLAGGQRSTGGLPTSGLPVSVLAGGLGGLPFGGLVGERSGDGVHTGGLPTDGLTGSLPTDGLTSLPSQLLGGQRSNDGLPTDSLLGGLPIGGLTGGGLPTDDLLGGLPTGDLLGGLPTNDVLGGLPVGGRSNDGLPTDDLLGGLPTDQLLGSLPIGTQSNGGLPLGGLTGALPTDGLPVGGRSDRGLPTGGVTGGLPTDGLTGALPTDSLLSGLPSGKLPNANLIGKRSDRGLPTEGLTGGLPTDGLLGKLPTASLTGERSESGLPTDGLTGGLPTGDMLGKLPLGKLPNLTGKRSGRGLPTDGVTGSLPTADLLGNLTGKRSDRGLPTDDLLGKLPIVGLGNELPTGGLPTGVLSGGLPVTLPGLPTGRDLPRTPELPLGGDLFAPLSGDLFAPVSGSAPVGLGGFGGRAATPADLTEITTIIPRIPPMDDVTAVLPVVPGGLPAAPVGTVPAVGSHELGGSSLDSTRAALANLFTTNPIS